MDPALRPLTTGEVLDRTFQIYRQNFILFAGISAIPNIGLLVVQLGLVGSVYATRRPTASTAIAAAVGGLGMLLVSLIVSAVATAATTFAVSDLYLNKTTSISACFSRVRGKLLKVIYTSAELGARVGLGFLLLIVPGIYWGGMYGIAVPAVVLEDIRARDAFKRSAQLTEGFRGRVIVVYFLTWVLTVVIALGAGAVLGAAGLSAARNAGTVTAKAVQYLIGGAVNTLVWPVMSIALTLVYYDQRVRKEAFDIETMMSLLDGTPASNVAAAGASPFIL